MKRFKNLMNRKFFSNDYDPLGNYTGNYMDFDEEDYQPEQDADDL